MFRILQRTILGELFKVFVLSLIGITGLIVLAAIIQEASHRGLPPAQILAAIPLIVPSMMPFIIPPTTLFAACIVFGRLAHDNEVTAVKAAGINVLHVVWPGVFLGAVMSAALFGMHYYLIPHCHHVLRTAVVNDIEELLYVILKKDHELRRLDLPLNYEIWVEQVQGRQLRNAIFKRRDAKGRFDVIATAREAELHVDMKRREVLVMMRHGQVLDEAGKTRFHFEEKDYSVPLPDVDRNRKPSPRELTWEQLQASRAEAIQSEGEASEAIARFDSAGSTPGSAADRALFRMHLQANQKEHTQRIRALDSEVHMRPALACGCFFFVLVGCPVGIWMSRSDYLSAFMTCFLPIILVYYPLHLCFTNLARDGTVPPMPAHWVANSMMGFIALGLFRKLMRN